VAHSPIYRVYIGDKQPQREADHCPLFSAEVNGTLQFTSVSSLHALYFCCTSFTVRWMLFTASYCDLTGYECAVVILLTRHKKVFFHCVAAY
jgi:hypothetical protein